MSATRSSLPLIRFGRLLLALVVCASMGLHWGALQAVAWGQMLVSYSQEADFSEAVMKTFDGAHPCNLCRAVQHGQSEEKNADKTPPGKKLDAVLMHVAVVDCAVVSDFEFSAFADRVVGRREAPPTPPPRA
jgi:hypothetical protein